MDSLWLVLVNWVFRSRLVSVFLHVPHKEDLEADLLGNLAFSEHSFVGLNRHVHWIAH